MSGRTVLSIWTPLPTFRRRLTGLDLMSCETMPKVERIRWRFASHCITCYKRTFLSLCSCGLCQGTLLFLARWLLTRRVVLHAISDDDDDHDLNGEEHRGHFVPKQSLPSLFIINQSNQEYWSVLRAKGRRIRTEMF